MQGCLLAGRHMQYSKHPLFTLCASVQPCRLNHAPGRLSLSRWPYPHTLRALYPTLRSALPTRPLTQPPAGHSRHTHSTWYMPNNTRANSLRCCH